MSCNKGLFFFQKPLQTDHVAAVNGRQAKCIPVFSQTVGWQSAIIIRAVKAG